MDSYDSFRRWLCKRFGVHHWRFIGMRRVNGGEEWELHACRWCFSKEARPAHVDVPPMV